jgi:hypothetical protein
MAPTKSVLYDRSGVCPACGTKSVYSDFISGAFTEEGRESDQHVITYRWLKPDLPVLHPPHYAIAVCPHCGYTDLKADFFAAEPGQMRSAKEILPLLKAATQQPTSPVAFLKEGLRPAPLDFPAALRLHLRAVVVQELLPPERRDHLKLARLYLRTGWLYREQGGGPSPGPTDPLPAAPWDALTAALGDARRAVELLAAGHASTPLGPELARLASRVGELTTATTTLRARELQATAPATPLGFLTILRGLWPTVPTTEAACLEPAVQALEQVYQRGDADTVALLKLMIDLNHRLQRDDRVLEYAAAISKDGQQERLKLQQQLAKRTLTTQEESRIVARMTRVTAALELAAEIRRDVKARTSVPA